MSSISAGTSTGTALVSTGDTTGALVFKTGASATTAMTIGADQSVTFAGAVSGIPGGGGTTASGSVVLTSASTGAQSITTTNYGQSVTLPNATTLSDGACLYTINNLGSYPLKIVNNAGSTLGFVYSNCPVTVGLADNSTAAGTWSLVGAEPYAVVAQTYSTALYNKSNISSGGRSVVIDANRTLLLMGLTNIYGIIYDASTSTWGTLTLIRTASISNYAAILSATDQVLICSNNTTTGMEAVALTISGTTITVGTAATATLSATENSSVYNLIAVGTSFVVTYGVNTPANQMRALTISAGVVTIGAATVLNGTTLTRVSVTAISASVVLVTSSTAASTFFATPYTVSGTTITLGTGATYATTSASSYQIRPISNGARLAVVIPNTGATSAIGIIISVAGTTASFSTVTLGTILNSGGTNNGGLLVSGSKLIFIATTSTGQSNILTDTSGTASAGTALTIPMSGDSVIPININSTTNKATFYTTNGSGALQSLVFDFSGSSLTLTSSNYQTLLSSGYSQINIPNFNLNYNVGTMLYGAISYGWYIDTTPGQRAIAIGPDCFYSFLPKYVPPTGNGLIFSQATVNKNWVYQPNLLTAGLNGLLQIIESTT
jgi:hypothetical protein